MFRRVCILAAATVLSTVLVLATMQLVCMLVSRIFGVPVHHDVIWLLK
jgi:hypothetical protein